MLIIICYTLACVNMLKFLIVCKFCYNCYSFRLKHLLNRVFAQLLGMSLKSDITGLRVGGLQPFSIYVLTICFLDYFFTSEILDGLFPQRYMLSFSSL